MTAENETTSFSAFQDALSITIIAKLAPETSKRKKAVKGRKKEIKPIISAESNSLGDAADLSEFVEYLAEEIFLSLPDELRLLSYSAVQDDPSLSEKYDLPLDTVILDQVVEHLPPTVSDSLSTYGLIKGDWSNLDRFIEPVISTYIESTTVTPPEFAPALTAARPDGCEICSREHLPLTYHHLIPRQMHDKAVKRGWHKEWELQKVAWLCRACHSYVHRILSNEELAREWYEIDKLLEREDVQKWAVWVSKIRWKAR